MRIRNLIGATLVGALVLGACSGSGAEQSESSGKKEKPTTTEKAPPIAPLTGLADPSGGSQSRCAVAVKIENSSEGRPQAGIAAADVVYNQVIDGGITRLLAVFNSEVPETVGPVRSVRPIDPKLVHPFGGVFAYSGGVPENVRAINGVPGLKGVDENDRDAMFRSRDRKAPYNLYARGDVLFERCPEKQAPGALFQYRGEADAAPVGEPVQAANVSVSPTGGTAVDYTWTGEAWDRSMAGKPFVDADGKQISTANAVVMFLQWQGQVGAFNAEGVVVGEGDAWVFTNGVVVKGRWVRPQLDDPVRFVDEVGNPVLFTPGKTWVELAPAGRPVTITAPEPPPTPSTSDPAP